MCQQQLCMDNSHYQYWLGEAPAAGGGVEVPEDARATAGPAPRRGWAGGDGGLALVGVVAEAAEPV